MGIKKAIRKLVLREKASSAAFINYLKKRGVTVGEFCYVPEPASVLVDLTTPWLLSLGNNVTLTHGVVILTHDYGWSVLKKNSSQKGRIIGSQAPVRIGNNVFVGVNTVILKGVTIGDNVIIGAGSVVSRDCEGNGVYAGNPAQRVMDLETYAAKRVRTQFEEARALAIAYREKFASEPPMGIFREYFMLFLTAQEAANIPDFRFQMSTGGNFDETFAYMNAHKPMFGSFKEFLENCYK